VGPRHRRITQHRWPVIVAVLAVALAIAGAGAVLRPTTARAAAGDWTGTWAVAPQSSGATFNRQTIRQIVRTSIGGTAARIKLSNVFGNQPVTFADVQVAQYSGGSSVVAGSSRTVTFNGAGSVTVPAGGSVVSDSIAFTVGAESDVAVSFYVPSATGNATQHQLGNQNNYVVAGDVAGQTTLSGAATTGSYSFLTNLDVQNPAAEGAVVTLGASLTDGYASTFGANHRWPNLLAGRLNSTGHTVGVLNAGISGNDLLKDGAGPSALNRFQRDVLQQPGAKWVVLSDDPINDLGDPNPPTATQLISGIQQLISAAHAAGLKFICSTLTPFKGAGYWTQTGENGRAAINSFIRGAGSGCDYILDQDTATHDPGNPQAFLPAYDCGDHLHPNDAGYQAIANAVDIPAIFGSGGGVRDLAQGRPVQASSVGPGTGLGAANAVDGSEATRWSSDYVDPSWLTVDLGAAYSISRVRLSWEAAYGRAYQIQTSPDGSSWTTVYSTSTGDGGVDDLTVSGTGHYVRMYGTQRATQWGYSLWSFQVLGL
jgi:lysophospholipase L1-like esterase